MAALMIHDINPGPMLMINTPEFLYQIVAMLVIADIAKLFYGLFLVRPLLWILLVPRERLMPVVFVLCCVGAFAITSRIFDIYVMVFFGFLGFILRGLKFPMAPMILGLVLGELFESNLTRGLVLSNGSIAPFFTRPISGARSRRSPSRRSSGRSRRRRTRCAQPVPPPDRPRAGLGVAAQVQQCVADDGGKHQGAAIERRLAGVLAQELDRPTRSRTRFRAP